MFQRASSGSPAGVSGSIGQPGSSAKLQCVIYGWHERSKGNFRLRYGPTTGGFVDYRFFQKVRLFTFEGLIAVSAPPGTTAVPPEPASWIGGQSEVVLQFHTSKTITLTVIIDSFNVSAPGDAEKQKTTEIWTCAGTCHIIGDPVYSEGWGTQATDATVTKADQQQYEGTSYTYDPDSLQTAGRILVDWFGLTTNTSAGLHTRLLAAIAANVTVAHGFDSGLKNRYDVIQQDADDGGVMTFNFALTTTGEDVLNGATEKADDPSDLQDSETTAAFNTTPGSSTISGLVSRGITYKEYNDSEVLQVKRWGRTTTEEDLTFPATVFVDDLSTIPTRSIRTDRDVTGSATPSNPTPAATFKLRSRSRHQLTDAGKWQHDFEMGLTTIQEDIENESSQIMVDVSGLFDQVTHGRVVATATTADPDGAPSGMVLRDTATTEINDSAFHRNYHYGYLTHAAEIEHRGTVTVGTLFAPATASVHTRQVVVGSSTDPEYTIAKTLYDAAINTKFFKSVSVRKPWNDSKYEATYLFQTDDYAIIPGRARQTRMYSSVDKSGTYISVVDAFEAGSGNFKYRLGGFEFDRLQIPFTIRRWFTSSTTVSTHMYPSSVGSTNNATFFGFAQGAVKLVSARPLADNYLLNGTNHAVCVDFDLVVDDFFWAIVKAPRPGYSSFDPTGTIVDTTQYAASAVNSQWATDSPSQISFAFILA